MDSHTKFVIAGLLENHFLQYDWEFNQLLECEQCIIGNQIQLDILKKFVKDQHDTVSKGIL
jgi:hypothetical protein